MAVVAAAGAAGCVSAALEEAAQPRSASGAALRLAPSGARIAMHVTGAYGRTTTSARFDVLRSDACTATRFFTATTPYRGGVLVELAGDATREANLPIFDTRGEAERLAPALAATACACLVYAVRDVEREAIRIWMLPTGGAAAALGELPLYAPGSDVAKALRPLGFVADVATLPFQAVVVIVAGIEWVRAGP